MAASDAVDDEVFDATVQALSDVFEAEAQQKLSGMLEMFPHLSIDVIQLYLFLSEDALVDKLVEISQDFSADLIEPTSFDCPVCFDTYPQTDGIFCTFIDDSEDDPHCFCRECVKQHAIASSTEVAMGRCGAGTKCLFPCCEGVILSARVVPLLSSNELKMFEQRVDDEAIGSFKDVERCMKCQYPMAVELSKEQLPIFECGQCNHRHCRLCDRLYDAKHEGRKCEDVVAAVDEARKRLEEQLTAAVVRLCSCGLAFDKTEGCNRMKCRCERTMCYMCREQDIDYNHFNGGKCAKHEDARRLQIMDQEERRRVLEQARGDVLIGEEQRQALE